MRTCPRLIILALAITQSPLRAEPVQLPQPPQQRARWTAPVTLPTNLLSAVETLFAQGFPDPRGCEYREIEVEVSGLWGGKTSLAKTRGWVLPGKARQVQRFAICWNGLIYPIAKVGAKADVHSEAMNLAQPPWRRLDSAVGETASVFSTNASSTRVLLLVRFGETEAALKNWSPDDEIRARSRRGELGSYDPYLQLAGDWAWAQFDATISAHMRTDEAFALATARKLTEVQPKIEAEAARRGFPRKQYYDPERQGKEKPYLDFLPQLPQLLADLERRGREPRRVSVVASGLTNLANPTERIAALVRDLDLVEARQSGQPGSVDLPFDPIVGALIQEGDAAVEPLLDCLETDKRLTRSVGFHRDFFRNRTVIPVSSAARTALQAILQAAFGNAAEMRAYWKQYGGLKLEERWYAILKDDNAGMGRWQEAAANITQPENLRTFPGTGWSVGSAASSNTPVRLLGEVLRTKSGPSISELLARRATELPPDSPESYDLGAACEIGLRLAAWDAVAAAPVARTLVERCRAVLKYSDQRNYRGLQHVGAFLAKLTVVRADNGDSPAFDDYATWLKTTTPAQLENSLAECLAPLHRFATNQTLQDAAESLFGDTNSAWGRLPWKASWRHRPEESELVKVPAFRRLLARELELKTVCGHVEWRAPNYASFTITNQGNFNSTWTLALPDNDRPVTGSKVELRWCDWIAGSLSNARQIPRFNPFAPVERRDTAIRDAKAALGQR